MAAPEQSEPAHRWPQWLTRLPLTVLGIGVVALALAVLYVEVPGRPLILHSLQKLGHPTVFGCIALILFGIRRRIYPFGGIQRDYVVVFSQAVAIGVATELGQALTHRDPTIKDVLLDARGIAGALALLAAYDPGIRANAAARWARPLLLALAAGVVALTIGPVLWVGSAYVHRSIAGPVLFAPDSALDLLLVSLTDTAPELGALPANFARSANERALRVPLTTRPYSGVVLDEPMSDWRGYHALRIDLINPSRTDLNLHVRIQDREHDGLFTDRFESVETISANSRRWVVIPIETIARGPLQRRLDLTRIGAVTLYKVGNEGPRELWLASVQLN
jgi:hypothetical protein